MSLKPPTRRMAGTSTSPITSPIIRVERPSQRWGKCTALTEAVGRERLAFRSLRRSVPNYLSQTRFMRTSSMEANQDTAPGRSFRYVRFRPLSCQYPRVRSDVLCGVRLWIGLMRARMYIAMHPRTVVLTASSLPCSCCKVAMPLGEPPT